MDGLREKQLTVRASRRPIEYNYTNADVYNIFSEPAEGYQFEYPVNWAGDPSTQKVIGIRRINYKPTSVNIAFNVIAQIVVEGETKEYYLPVTYVFTDQNTFEECIAEIIKKLNEELFKQLPQEEDVRFNATYDKDKNVLARMKETTTSSKDKVNIGGREVAAKQSVERERTKFNENGDVSRTANVKKDFENGLAMRKTTTMKDKDGNRVDISVDKAKAIASSIKYGIDNQKISETIRDLNTGIRTVSQYKDGRVSSVQRFDRSGKLLP
jgi:flagellar basal body rod protein FlgB